jgi:transposase-like protein
MVQSEGSGAERRVRRWGSVAEKRWIVELTLEPGASIALVARVHGVNANQIFKWYRAFEPATIAQAKRVPACTPSKQWTGLPDKLTADLRPSHKAS